MGGIKDRKLFVAALALALGALALDKTVFRGGLSPGAAEASDLLVRPGEPSAAAPARAQAESENCAEIAQRLAAARDRLMLDPANVPDAFFGAGLNGKAAEKEAQLGPAERFRERYTLHAVMRAEGGSGVALLETKDKDGKPVKLTLKVGDKAGEAWTLVAVETQSKSRSATFESDDCTVVLTLPGPNPEAIDQNAQEPGSAGR